MKQDWRYIQKNNNICTVQSESSTFASLSLTRGSHLFCQKKRTLRAYCPNIYCVTRPGFYRGLCLFWNSNHNDYVPINGWKNEQILHYCHKEISQLSRQKKNRSVWIWPDFSLRLNFGWCDFTFKDFLLHTKVCSSYGPLAYFSDIFIVAKICKRTITWTDFNYALQMG